MEIYHSSTENITFEIVGYSPVDHTSNVIEKISLFRKESESFAATTGMPIEHVCTEAVNIVSRRYRYMRVYYTKQTKEELKNCTLPVFEIGKDWTMQKWLEF